MNQRQRFGCFNGRARRRVATIAGCMLLCHSAVFGQFIVDQSGLGTHTTIQAAIDAASDGDDILVRAGVYLERVDFLGKAVRVHGAAPEDDAVVAATVIDGEAGGHVVTFANQEPDLAVLEGLTIRNGSAEHGGGIYCVAGASPTIRRNRIIENFCVLHGGGVHCGDGARPLIIANDIRANNCEGRGAGVYVEFSAARIEGNVIQDNLAGCSSGGGIHLDAGADAAIVIDNLIVGNRSTFGAGVQTEDSSPRIERNTIIGNLADPRGAGVSCVDGAPVVVGNIIAGNRSEIAAGIECNNASAIIAHNTLVGNRSDEAAVILAINNSHIQVIGNIIAFHPHGFAVQAVPGASAFVDYCCVFGNEGGLVSGEVNLGAGNIFSDPQLDVNGLWAPSPPIYGPTCGGAIAVRTDLAGVGEGEARYRFTPAQHRFRVEVRDFPAFGTFNVTINGVLVGQLITDDRGRGRLRYESEDGTFPADFPTVAIGDVVDVGGLASGAFQSEGVVWTTVWSPGDEHLQTTSPCVDAGTRTAVTPEFDIDGQPRQSGDGIDIGADERVQAAGADAGPNGAVDWMEWSVRQDPVERQP